MTSLPNYPMLVDDQVLWFVMELSKKPWFYRFYYMRRAIIEFYIFADVLALISIPMYMSGFCPHGYVTIIGYLPVRFMGITFKFIQRRFPTMPYSFLVLLHLVLFILCFCVIYIPLILDSPLVMAPPVTLLLLYVPYFYYFEPDSKKNIIFRKIRKLTG